MITKPTKLFIISMCTLLAVCIAKADTIFFKDGMKTVCQDKAWEENESIYCEYEGSVISYSKNDVLRIEKSVAKKPSEQHTIKQTVLPNLSTSRLLNDDTQKTAGIAFYDPRRPKKYWASETSRHETFKSAIAALGKEFDHSPEWVEAHMGDTNDLNEIRRNLSNSKSMNATVTDSTETVDFDGILFYDPRRPFKYWTSKASKHKTFNEALDALATEFDRSPEWIETHMGETNELGEIRRNLTRAASAESSK